MNACLTRRRAAGPAVAALLLALAVAVPAAAQVAPDLYLHALQAGAAQAAPIPLSVTDAVNRGLAANLALIQQQSRETRAGADQTSALSSVLPTLTGSLSAVREKVSLAAFGFTGFPGADFPTLVGPFNVVDARLTLTAAFDLAATAEVSSKNAASRAEAHATNFTRQQIIYAVALLYEQALATDSRLAAVRSQAATAEALARLAHDQKTAGVIAGIDVIRQDVALEAAKQRLVTAANDADKSHLRLARAIGLPLGQAFTMTSAITYAPAPTFTFDAALAQAYAQREDLKGADERTQAADASVRAASYARLPTIHVEADYGRIGNDIPSVLGTYSAAAVLRVPLFDGRSTHARAARATADLTARTAEANDQRAGVYYEVRTALLDMDAADAAVKVATEWRDLANLQLTQARDRFAAGVANTIELAQAQESVATAEDNYIATLFSHVMAKAALARTLGTPETTLFQYLGGSK